MNKENGNVTFQKSVDQFLIQHRSILDLMTKYQESNARVNRAIAKAVTQCGCIKIKAKKQIIPSNTKLTEIYKFMDTHIEGSLCDSCKEIIETELGASLFSDILKISKLKSFKYLFQRLVRWIVIAISLLPAKC